MGENRRDGMSGRWIRILLFLTTLKSFETACIKLLFSIWYLEGLPLSTEPGSGIEQVFFLFLFYILTSSARNKPLYRKRPSFDYRQSSQAQPANLGQLSHGGKWNCLPKRRHCTKCKVCLCCCKTEPSILLVSRVMTHGTSCRSVKCRKKSASCELYAAAPPFSHTWLIAGLLFSRFRRFCVYKHNQRIPTTIPHRRTWRASTKKRCRHRSQPKPDISSSSSVW